MYKHHRTNHSRLLNREFLQKISLCFLIGFLCGAVFYYCFQNSFREILQATLENNTKTWTKETALFTEWFRSLWNHGKYFALIWLLAISPAGPVSQKIFVVYTGIRNGFLFVFFLQYINRFPERFRELHTHQTHVFNHRDQLICHKCNTKGIPYIGRLQNSIHLHSDHDQCKRCHLPAQPFPPDL